MSIDIITVGFCPQYDSSWKVGKQPPPSNTCPPPKTMEQLLLPCDEREP